MKPSPCTLLVSTLGLAQAPVPPSAPPQAASHAPSQTPAPAATASRTFEAAIVGVEGLLVGAAEAMPEDKFGYVPTGGEFKDVRTFAQQIKHVAASNFMAGERISGLKPSIDVEKSLIALRSKAELMRFLKDSFAFAREAVGGMKETDLYTPVPSPWGPGETTRLMVVLIPLAHSMDHYGQMVVYLRHNGIVPPASRR